MGDKVNSRDPKEVASLGAEAPTHQGVSPPGESGSRLGPGQVLAGRYEIVEYLGAGGSGAVYAAHDHLIGEPVAIKLLHERLREDPAQVARLRAEVRAARRIAHPNVCRVHDLAEASGLVFVVMERVHGDTLRQRLRRPIGTTEALEIVRQVAAGLAAAHRAGVVHCDVKPENVVVSADRVVLTDFGVAHLFGGGERVAGKPGSGTSGSTIEGTPAYMAPEQVMGRPVDERTDVYGMAAVVCELLFGSAPFGHAVDRSALVEQLHRILHDPPQFSAAGLPDATPEARARVIATLTAGLAKDPADRPESVEALTASVLAAVCLGGGSSLMSAAAATGSTPTPPSSPTPRTGRRSAPAASPRGVRRIATVLHVAIGAGSAADVDEEEIADRIDALQSAAEALIADAGGIVAARGPRSLIAVFGAVASRGDEPQRAADAARAIVGAAGDPTALRVRVGLDTGRLLVRPGRGDGLTVSGPPLEEAERMAAAAHSGEVWAGRRGARHLARAFRLEPAPDHAARVGERRHVAETAALRPLLGRDAELEQLVRALAAVAGGGAPRAALLHGPPGIGTSRLAREVEDALATRGRIAVIRAQAQPGDAYASHALLRSLVRRLLAVADDASPQEIERSVVRALGRATGSGPDPVVAEALAALLTGRAVSSGVPALAAAKAALASTARRQPQLLILDDLQWADEASLDFVESLARLEVDAPVALLACARPALLQRRPRMAARFPLSIALGPLSRADSLALITSIIGPGKPERAAEIVAAADGNPFFLEELAAATAADGDAAPASPTTIEAAIQARLDRLMASERMVLRAAAVLGRRFGAGELAEVLGAVAPEIDVDGALATLEEGGFVFALPPDAQSEDRYVFKHALVQDAAYHELPVAMRRSLHAAAAARLRRSLAGSAGEPGVEIMGDLARHLDGAEDHAAAAIAYRQAGDLCSAQSAIADAYRCYLRARELAGGGATVDLLLPLGETACRFGALDDAAAALSEALALTATDPAAARDAALVHRALAAVARERSQWQLAVDHCRRGLALIDEQSEPVIAARLLASLGWVLSYQLGDVAEGVPAAERAVGLLENTPHLADLAAIYASLGACYVSAGRWAERLDCHRRTLELGERLGNIELRARAHLNLGENLRSLGRIDEAVENTRRACALYERMGTISSIGLSHNNIALSLIELEDVDGAEREVTEALRISRRCGLLYYQDEAELTMARVNARRGRHDDAERHAIAAVEHTARSGAQVREAAARRVLAAVRSWAGDHEAALQELDRAEALVRDRDDGELARVLAERSRTLRRRGDQRAAVAPGERARELFARLQAAHEIDMLDELRYC